MILIEKHNSECAICVILLWRGRLEGGAICAEVSHVGAAVGIGPSASGAFFPILIRLTFSFRFRV